MDVDKFLNTIEKSVDISYQPHIVLPGDNVQHTITKLKKQVNIGSGLVQCGTEDVQVLCEGAGVLKYREPSTYWVDNDNRRYIARTGDQVVGIIEDRTADFYRVNIFSDSAAILGRMSFEGATKRNRPEFKVGDVVYCRVSLAHKDLDTELTCISASGSKKGWSSGEAIYGELTGGIMVRVSTGYAKRLLKPDCVVLNVLGRHLPYEVAVGVNGAVWIKAASPHESIVIRNAILNANTLDDFRTEAMVDILVRQIKERRMHDEN